jgi:hypothetical protein
MPTCIPRCSKAQAANKVGKKTEYLKNKITELETNRTRISETSTAALINSRRVPRLETTSFRMRSMI